MSFANTRPVRAGGVAVPEHAYMLSSQPNLSEYYERLGFEPVEMKDGARVLLYTGTSTDAWEALSGNK